jgi:hypothetical protein
LLVPLVIGLRCASDMLENARTVGDLRAIDAHMDAVCAEQDADDTDA